VPLEATLTQCS